MLLQHLVRIGREDVLLENERDLLERDDVKSLPAVEQLAYLASNRRVGFWVTMFAAGVRVMVLGGGGVALLALGGAGELGMTLGGSALLIVTGWLTGSLIGRLRKLRRTIPTGEDLGIIASSE